MKKNEKKRRDKRRWRVGEQSEGCICRHMPCYGVARLFYFPRTIFCVQSISLSPVSCAIFVSLVRNLEERKTLINYSLDQIKWYKILYSFGWGNILNCKHKCITCNTTNRVGDHREINSNNRRNMPCMCHIINWMIVIKQMYPSLEKIKGQI